MNDEEQKKEREDYDEFDGGDMHNDMLASNPQENYGYPESPTSDGVYRFFRQLLSKKDNSKVGNLRNEEMGSLRLPVRDYQDLANYSRVEGLELVAEYMDRKADIILTTSNSRGGFLSQLFVTQIKKDKREKVKSSEPKSFWNKKSE